VGGFSLLELQRDMTKLAYDGKTVNLENCGRTLAWEPNGIILNYVGSSRFCRKMLEVLAMLAMLAKMLAMLAILQMLAKMLAMLAKFYWGGGDHQSSSRYPMVSDEGPLIKFSKMLAKCWQYVGNVGKMLAMLAMLAKMLAFFQEDPT
jgi:hypothetical protein